MQSQKISQVGKPELREAGGVVAASPEEREAKGKPKEL
jgi:hypothetical protein